METLAFHSGDIFTWSIRFRCSLAFLLAFLFPASQLAAQTSGTMLYPQGKVLVDGRDVNNPLALFAGDKVQTDANASASLTAVGSSVLLSPQTYLVYDPSAPQMGCGHLLVTTVVNRMPAHVANLIVTASSDVAKYEITRARGKLEIVAREGSINVNDGAQTSNLEAGKLIRSVPVTTVLCPLPRSKFRPLLPSPSA